MPLHSKVLVAIPVKNEAARIGACLEALAAQAADFDELLLLLNNCTDKTLPICRGYADRFGKLHIMARNLPAGLACAGEARRLALRYAAARAGNGIVLTTDADAVPGPDWVAANLRAIEAGADIVCGRAMLDPTDAAAIPAVLMADEKNEALLLSIQDEIAAMIDPDLDDPWPRHQQHSGASLAMRTGILRKGGGAPRVATGEDRALIERLRRVDARIRHCGEIAVCVSGRLEGRADGGMAATLKRRLQQRDIWTDERLEPTVDAYRRMLARQRLRAAFLRRENSRELARDLLIPLPAMRQLLQRRYFGAAWSELQRLSPVLQRRRVAFSQLEQEIRHAVRLRAQLRRELQDPMLPSDECDLSRDENAQ